MSRHWCGSSNGKISPAQPAMHIDISLFIKLLKTRKCSWWGGKTGALGLCKGVSIIKKAFLGSNCGVYQ